MLDVSKINWTNLYNYAAKIVQMYRDALAANKVDASGQLSSTTDFDVSFEDYHVSVYLIMQSYWYYVEKGRNPSTGKWGTWATKYSDVENWLRQKIARGSFVPSHGHTIPRTPKEIERVSYVIARKITRFGFYGFKHEGKNILEKVMDEVDKAGVLDKIIDEIVKAYDKRISIEFEKL